MFAKLKVFKEAGARLYPYFTPSYHNSIRTAGFIASLVVIPVVNFFMPRIFLKKDSNLEDDSNNFDVITALATVAVVSLLRGVQKSLCTLLSASTMQAIRKKNIQLLLDEESKFLMHGNNKDITSLQYTTVGVGVRDFAWSAVPMFVSIPMYAITSLTTLINIGITTGSFTTSGVVLVFVTASTVAMYVSDKRYFFYNANNQKIENDLVAKIGFIEAHRDSIPLIGASGAEYKSVIQNLQEVDDSIPKLFQLDFFCVFITSVTTAIASQFLGGYYKDISIQNINDSNAKVLNIMLMSLIANIQDMVRILTDHYSIVELNLEQLNAFDKAHSNCLFTRNANNKMKQEFKGNCLSLTDFCVYKPHPEDVQNIALIALFDKVTLELLPNRVYKLSAESGSGKTTFLKAITNNWQYTDGIVKLPANAKYSMCFIPQNSFIPTGTLLEILTYPLKPQEFLATYPMSALIDKTNLQKPLEFSEGKDKIQYVSISSHTLESVPLLEVGKEESSIQYNTMFLLIDKVKSLLTAVRLLPSVIREEDELKAENINWNNRLSGGEKQKIGIIRALLVNPKFIIMDEATSALDIANKQIVYKVVKDYIASLQENYTIIYTDHGVTESFADTILTISGQSLEYHDLV